MKVKRMQLDRSYSTTSKLTCDKKASSLPLLNKDGKTSPWPGGYLE